LVRLSSYPTQARFLTACPTDIFTTFTQSYYNGIFKILFISSSGYTLYLMMTSYRPTQSAPLDTFRVQYLLLGSAILAVLFPPKYTTIEILWSFSLWLESVAILPQLFMLQRTGEADTITVHYIAALGAYRALYIPNWIWRYWADGHLSRISVLAGLVQTVLYSDFFWIYYTKVMRGKKFALPV
jgi:ER lumen protein retaining receptor